MADYQHSIERLQIEVDFMIMSESEGKLKELFLKNWDVIKQFIKEKYEEDNNYVSIHRDNSIYTTKCMVKVINIKTGNMTIKEFH